MVLTIRLEHHLLRNELIGWIRSCRQPAPAWCSIFDRDGVINQELVMSDGYSISDSGVQQLVQAMAAHSPPAAGQTTLPPNLASSLRPALTANWQHA